MVTELSFAAVQNLIGLQGVDANAEFQLQNNPMPQRELADRVIGKLKYLDGLYIPIQEAYQKIANRYPYDYLVKLAKVIVGERVRGLLTINEKNRLPVLLHWYFESFMNEDNDERKVFRQYRKNVEIINSSDKETQNTQHWLSVVFYLLSKIGFSDASEGTDFNDEVEQSVKAVCQYASDFLGQADICLLDLEAQKSKLDEEFEDEKFAGFYDNTKDETQNKGVPVASKTPVGQPPLVHKIVMPNSIGEVDDTRLDLKKLMILQRILECTKLFYIHQTVGDNLCLVMGDKFDELSNFIRELSEINVHGATLYDYIIALINSNNVEDDCQNILSMLNVLSTQNLDECLAQFHEAAFIRFDLEKQYPKMNPLNNMQLTTALVTVKQRYIQGEKLNDFFGKMRQDVNRLHGHTTKRHVILNRKKLYAREAEKSEALNKILISLVISSKKLFEVNPFDREAYQRIFQEFSPEKEKKIASHSDIWKNYRKKLKNAVVTCLSFGIYPLRHHLKKGVFFSPPKSRSFKNAQKLKDEIYHFWQMEPNTPATKKHNKKRGKVNEGGEQQAPQVQLI